MTETLSPFCRRMCMQHVRYMFLVFRSKRFRVMMNCAGPRVWSYDSRSVSILHECTVAWNIGFVASFPSHIFVACSPASFHTCDTVHSDVFSCANRFDDDEVSIVFNLSNVSRTCRAFGISSWRDSKMSRGVSPT